MKVLRLIIEMSRNVAVTEEPLVLGHQNFDIHVTWLVVARLIQKSRKRASFYRSLDTNETKCVKLNSFYLSVACWRGGESCGGGNRLWIPSHRHSFLLPKRKRNRGRDSSENSGRHCEKGGNLRHDKGNIVTHCKSGETNTDT